MRTRGPGIIGCNVRAARTLKGMSGNALAQAAGISQGHLWDIETGRVQDPAASVVAALAKALGTSMDDLLRAPAAESALPKGD